MLDENKYMIMVGDYNQEIRPKNKEEYEENVIGMKEESYTWDDREEEDR